MITLEINGKRHEVEVDPNMPLLWVLRDHLGLTGTKYGCGEGLCGACTVHIDEDAVPSCQVPAKDAAGKRITTIEGISEHHPVKQAWIAEDVPQCGYCHSGQIMQAVAFLKENPHPDDADIDNAMGGHICRCGTYQRIRRAIHTASKTAAKGGRK